MKIQGLTLFFIFLAINLGVALSQKPGNSDTIFLNVDSSAIKLNEVTVTAYQTGKKLKNISAAITYISNNWQTKLLQENLLNTISLVPGVNVQQGTLSTSHISIRGIGTRYAYGTRKIKVFYDDIPLTNGESDTFIDDISPEDAGSIEIIRGPASSVYGSGLGGTILINPKSASAPNNLEYTFNAGSFGLLKNGVEFHSSSRSNVIDLNINNIHENGFRQNNDYMRTSVTAHLGGNLSAKTRYTLLFSGAKVKAGIPSSIDSATFYSSPEKAAATWLKTKGNENYLRYYTGGNITSRLTKNSQLKVVAYNAYRKNDEVRPFNILAENSFIFGGKLLYFLNYEFNRNIISISSGINTYQEMYRSSTFANINGEGTSGNKETEGAERIWQNDAFIQGEIQFHKKYSLVAGVNANSSGFNFKDIYSEDTVNQSGNYRFKPIVSPRIAFHYSITQNLGCYAEVSNGFSVPSLSETLSPLGLINRNIKPEKAWNIETGLRGLLLNNKLFVDLAFYWMFVRDLIVPKRIAEDVYVGMNAGESVHSGIELSLKYNIAGRQNGFGDPATDLLWFVQGSYTHNNFIFKNYTLDSVDYKGKHLPGVPDDQLYLSSNVNFRFGLYAIADYEFTGKMPMTDGNSIYTKHYQIFNFTAGYKKTIFKHLIANAFFKISNLTDKLYASMVVINAVGAKPRYYYPGEPRNSKLGFTLSYQF